MINLFCNCLGLHYSCFMYYEIFYHYVVVHLFDFRYVIGICKIFFFFFLFFWNEIMKLKRLMKYIHLWAYLWLYNLYEYELVKVISYNRYLCKVVMACLIFSHWFNEDTFFSGASLKKQQKLGYEMCIFFFCLFLHLPMYRRCLRYIFWKDEDRFQNIFVAHTLLNNMCGTRLIFT